MAMKFDFDWKNFLLQKGEKIGFGVGLAVLALMLVFGIKGVFSGSPSANAEVLNKKTQRAQELLVKNQPKDMKEFEVDPTLMTTQATLDAIEADKMRAVASLFVPFALDDYKRREPKIEQAVAMGPLYTEVQVLSHMFDQEGKQIWVLRGQDVKAQDQRSLQATAGRVQGGMGGPGMGGPGMGGRGMGGPGMGGPGMGGPGMGGPGMGGPGMGGPGMGGPGMGMARNTAQPGAGQGRRNLMGAGVAQGPGGIAGDAGADKSQKKDRALVPIEQLGDQKDVRLADKVLPLRMVIWEGAFPLRKQVENMKSALHSPTLGEAFRELHFAGFNVQRREIGLDGRPIGDWAEFGFEDAIWVVVRASGRRFSEENPELKPLILNGLVYRLPEQFEHRKYPSAFEDHKLKDLEKTLTAIREKGQSLDAVQGPSQFEVGSADVLFSEGAPSQSGSNIMEGGGGKAGLSGGGRAPQATQTAPSAGRRGARGGGKDGLAAEDGPGATAAAGASTPVGADWEPPEYCMVRFFDVVVDPGRTYEYRYQIRLKNPNKGKDKEVAYKELAEKAVVTSPWFELPQRVSIPADFHFYAVDMKEVDPKTYRLFSYPGKDQVAVQLQRWVDQFDPADSRTLQPVGDWAVAERELFARGEFVGGTRTIELPVWSWFDERFVIATHPTDRRQKKVPVPFTESDSQCPVLVDFSGGTVAYAKPDEPRRPIEDKDVPREMLLLSPDGRLFVRNSVIDAKDPAREAHYKWWRDRIKEVKESKDPKKDGKGGDGASPFSGKGGTK